MNFLFNSKHFYPVRRNLSSVRTRLVSSQAVLGIETSCDDTGAAVIDAANGQLLGEALHSQTREHMLHGGIRLPVARDLHAQHIEEVVSKAMQQAGLGFGDLHAVATTVKPGLPLSLIVGKDFGKRIALDHNLPFVPIHHMEAHTLTIRMIEQVEFPFLCLLASGGHCLLVLCRDIDSYQLLGSSLDDAPGEALDKGARYLCLRSLPSCVSLSGGAAIEQLARGGDHLAYTLGSGVAPLSRRRDCNFSFAGTKQNLKQLIARLEKEHGLEEDDCALPLPVLRDVCASYQHALLQHLTRRTHRALLYLSATDIFPEGHPKTLVVSGGVASNALLRRWLEKVCGSLGWRVLVPPPRLCTDNGVMIAWNGVERIRAGRGVLTDRADIEAVDIMGKCPLGEDISGEVADMHIKVHKWIKL